MSGGADQTVWPDPLLQSRAMPPSPAPPQLHDAGDAVEVAAAAYSWRLRELRATSRAHLLSGRVLLFDAIRLEPARVIVDVRTQIDGEPVELIEIRFG